MDIEIKQGNIKAALDLESKLPEFPRCNTLSDYKSKLLGRASLILVASVGSVNVGFKVGYAESATEFYSWVGGVIPEYRNLGVAKKLLVAQETWAKSNGFSVLNVNTYNRFPNMICLLVANGYTIVDFAGSANTERSKLSFSKKLHSV